MGSVALEVVVGLFVIYFMLSLAASALMSILKRWMSLRARSLRMGVGQMFGGDREIVDRFFANPIVTSAVGDGRVENISPDAFVASLARAILPKGAKGDPIGALPAAIQNLGEGPLKDKLELVVPNEFASGEEAASAIKLWYANAVGELKRAYEMLVQKVMYIIAAIIVIGLNVNTIEISKALINNKELRDSLNVTAEALSQMEESEALGPEAQRAALECVRATGRIPYGWKNLSEALNMPEADPQKCEEMFGEDFIKVLSGKSAESDQPIDPQADSIGGENPTADIEGSASEESAAVVVTPPSEPVAPAESDTVAEAALASEPGFVFAGVKIQGPMDIIYLIVGWWITVVAVAQGAPFWFEMLRGIRGRGTTPPPAPTNPPPGAAS
ncbi:MAG: hypothetical protein AAGC77_10595 [Pseudomonadota bacterium]